MLYLLLSIETCTIPYISFVHYYSCSSLYIFYMQAKSYSEVQDSSIVVSLSGDIGEARAFQSQQLGNSGKCTILEGMYDHMHVLFEMMKVETQIMKAVKSNEG